jgi:protein-tyrosine phosphatase
MTAMRWVTDTLAVGNIENAMDVETLRAAGVTAVLGLNRFPSLRHVADLDWRRVELIDGHGNASDHVMLAIQVLEELLGRHRVLLHCDAGRSRSPFIAACYLARRLSCGFCEAIAIVQARLHDASIDAGLLAILPLLDLAPRPAGSADTATIHLPRRTT